MRLRTTLGAGLGGGHGVVGSSGDGKERRWLDGRRRARRNRRVVVVTRAAVIGRERAGVSKEPANRRSKEGVGGESGRLRIVKRLVVIVVVLVRRDVRAVVVEEGIVEAIVESPPRIVAVGRWSRQGGFTVTPALAFRAGPTGREKRVGQWVVVVRRVVVTSSVYVVVVGVVVVIVRVVIRSNRSQLGSSRARGGVRVRVRNRTGTD